jgi:hypothetical protein
VRNEEVKDDEVKIERNVKMKMMMKQKLREEKIDEENNGRN